MFISGDYKVLRENRIWIYEDIVFAVFASLEFQLHLFGRTVICTKETFPRFQGCRIHFSCRRFYPSRVVLEFYIQAIYLKITDFDVFQRTEVRRCKRPN